MIHLRRLRRMAGLTQFALAHRSGITRMKLSLAECGEIDLSAEETAAVRKALRHAIKRRFRQIRAFLMTNNALTRPARKRTAGPGAQ